MRWIRLIDNQAVISDFNPPYQQPLVTWDGNGVVGIGAEFFNGRADIEMGTQIVVGKHQLLIMARFWEARGYIAMLDTPEAHRLLIWSLARVADEHIRIWSMMTWERLTYSQAELNAINSRVFDYQ